MKITHNKVGQNLNVVDTKTDKADKLGGLKNSGANLPNPALQEGALNAAQVDLSPRAQEARRIKELAMAGPDVDQAKVEKFRQLIDEGKYKVDSDKVASSMVDEHME